MARCPRRIALLASTWLALATTARADTALPPEDPLAPVALEEGNADPECHELAETTKAMGKIQVARLVECSAEYETAHRLALRVGGKWYLTESLLSSERNGGLNSDVKEPQLAADKGLLLLRAGRATSNRGERNRKGELNGDSTDESFLVVCGVGDSHAPSCTPAIKLSWRNTYHAYPSEKRKDKVKAWEVKAKLKKDALELAPVAAGPRKQRAKVDDETRNLLGKHALRFP